MSSFYLDVLKDRLYTFKADSMERRAAQWLSQILSTMTRLCTFSFTAEEVWQNTSRGKERRAESADKEESVFLALFPEVDENITTWNSKNG
jgi:isoleucyl-tRNA synthetase